ncbi:MAG: glycosyltransferase family 2 protein, partial [Lachnospiraceae bacterium]|nr:glycosyltransferase family 2 protein [Lachnospiraceae bacterium]
MSKDMDNKASVSIIIPIYNIEEELLRRSVGSVMSQTYDKLELILVDDGSSDGTGELVDRLVTEYTEKSKGSGGKTIRAFHKENGGSSSARNLGIKNATGDYIGFVDSDDYVDEDFVSLMMEAVVKYDLVMAQISRDEIAADGSKLPDVCTPPNSEKIITAREQLRELLLHKGDCSFCTRLTARKLFEGREFPEGKLNEDFYLLVNMLPDIKEYVILPKQAYHVYYRIGSNSRSGDKDVFRQVYKDIVDNADFAEKLVEEKYPELKSEAKRFALYQRLDY